MRGHPSTWAEQRDWFGSVAHFSGGSAPAGYSTTTSNQGPWSVQAPYLQSGYQGAQGLYGSGGPQYYPGSTYSPLTEPQSNAIGQLAALGQQDGLSGVGAGNAYITSLLGGANVAPLSNNGYAGSDVLNNIGTGGYGLSNLYAPGMNAGAYISSLLSGQPYAVAGTPYNYGMNAITNQASGNSTAASTTPYNLATNTLSSYLTPGYLNPYSNPGYASAVQNTLAQVLPQINSQFNEGGTPDSSEAAFAAGQGATSALGQLASQQYNQNVAQQQAAAQQASQNYMQGLGLQQGAAGLGVQNMLGVQGLENQAAQMGISGLLGATGQQANAAQANLGAMQTAEQQQLGALTPAALLNQSALGAAEAGLGASGLLQQNNQNWLNSGIANWNYNQMRPWMNLGLYQNAIAGNPGGTASVSSPYFQNQTSNILSGLTGGLGIANGLFGNNGLVNNLTSPGGLFGSGGLGSSIVSGIGNLIGGF